MIDDGLSTKELLALGRGGFDLLERCVKTRRRRDRASDGVTDLFLIVEALGRRLGALEWQEKAPAADDAEEERDLEPRVEVSLHDLMRLAEEDSGDCIDDTDVAVLKLRVRELEAQRLDCFRSIIRYTTAGCKSADQVTKKWLALVRRVDPHSLRDLGMSQAAVARALGERRATTSAREKREFEGPMKRAGARGYHGSGGLRSEQNRINCAKAQRGNRNRATGHAKHSQEVSGNPETSAKRTKPKSRTRKRTRKRT